MLPANARVVLFFLLDMTCAIAGFPMWPFFGLFPKERHALVFSATGFLFPCCPSVAQSGCGAISDKFPEFPVSAGTKSLCEHSAQIVSFAGLFFSILSDVLLKFTVVISVVGNKHITLGTYCLEINNAWGLLFHWTVGCSCVVVEWVSSVAVRCGLQTVFFTMETEYKSSVW